MLDIKFVRANPELVIEGLKKRGADLSLAGFLELDQKRREKLAEVEALKSQRNKVSEEIGKMKRLAKMLTDKWRKCA